MIDLLENNIFEKALSPLEEMAAYEALWSKPRSSFKKIADLFRANHNVRISDLVSESDMEVYIDRFLKLKNNELPDLHVLINGTGNYPAKLRDAKNPLELLYYQGNINLIYSKSVAVVGARKVSDEGKRRTRKLTKELVSDGYTIVSGLAEGVDTVAHSTALLLGGNTIAVIGTPLNHYYPKSNSQLQNEIAKNHLLISQVPFSKYENQDYRSNRSFFPERNITMSAISEATIIVEASDTSGTLYQARAALAQGRKLFILDSCFNNPNISWPEKFAKKGAIRVKEYDDIRKELAGG